MKKRTVLIVWFLLLATVLTACDKNEVQHISNRNQSTNIQYNTPPQEKEINQPNNEDGIPSQTLITEEEALKLIESKLGQEALRISYLGLAGTDEMGNYIIRQASSATTEVMEWYHVNPKTQEITCEILEDYCLQNSEEDVAITEPLTDTQLEAIQIAREYAKENYLEGSGYVDGITYVVYSHEDENGNIVIWIFNPGSGRTNTIDWLTVDVTSKQVISSQMGFFASEEDEQ